MRKKVLITGIMGQDGAYLAKFLLSKKYKVYGAYRRNSNYENNRLRKLGIEDKVELIDLEINEFSKPIAVPGGFLILQINDIDDAKFEVNIENELKKLINFERNDQLNQYSKIYFNKIKKNLQIDEL